MADAPDRLYTRVDRADLVRSLPSADPRTIRALEDMQRAAMSEGPAQTALAQTAADDAQVMAMMDMRGSVADRTGEYAMALAAQADPLIAHLLDRIDRLERRFDNLELTQ